MSGSYIGSFESESKVLLTWASSVDGSLSAEVGRPTSISCNESMIFTHKLRASYDGILVGIGTVCADNPSLTVRLCEGESPTPIILDPKLRIPLHCKIIQAAKLRKVCLLANSFYNSDNDVLERKRVLENLGAAVLFCSPLLDDNAEIDLQVAIRRLREEMNLNKVMVEGGQRVLRSFIHQHLSLKKQNCGKLVDQVIVTVSPKLILGGVTLGLGYSTGLLSPLEVQNASWSIVGSDAILTGTL